MSIKESLGWEDRILREKEREKVIEMEMREEDHSAQDERDVLC